MFWDSSSELHLPKLHHKVFDWQCLLSSPRQQLLPDGRKSSKCNTKIMEHFGRWAPAEAFSGTRIDKIDNGIYKLLRNSVEIAALWEEETQQSIGVFVRSALPMVCAAPRNRPKYGVRLPEPWIQRIQTHCPDWCFLPGHPWAAGRSQLSLAKRPASLTRASTQKSALTIDLRYK